MIDASNSSLVIPITKIDKATNKTLAIYFKTPIELADDIGRLLEPLEGTFTLEIKQNFVLCRGEFDCLLMLNCDRCLNDFNYPLKLTVNEALEIVEFIDADPELELQYQDAYEQVTMEDAIDIYDLLRQHIILNLPLKKVCSETCYNTYLKSLDESSQNTIDPRWEKLKELSQKWESS